MFEDITDCVYAYSSYIEVLYSPTNVLIPAHDKVLVDVGVAFQIPMGYYGWIASRSGLAIHHHIHVGAGVVTNELTFNTCESQSQDQDSPVPELSATIITFNPCKP